MYSLVIGQCGIYTDQIWEPADRCRMAKCNAMDRLAIKRVLDGDANAFESIIEQYRGQVFAIVLNHVGPRWVDDVTHDAFIRVYRSLSKYRGDSPLEHWISRITLFTCCDFWRKRKRNRELPMSQLTENQTGWLESAAGNTSREAFDTALAKSEAKDVLDWALAHIAPKDRTLLMMVNRDGYSMADAAHHFGWSVSKAKIRAHRARAKLRILLERELKNIGVE